LRCFNQDYLSFQIKEEEWEGLCNSCFILKDWVIDKVGYYDESYFPAYMEDIDMIERLNRLGIEKKSTFMSVVKHDEGATSRGNDWKLTEECNTSGKLYEFAYVRNKAYFNAKWGFCPN